VQVPRPSRRRVTRFSSRASLRPRRGSGFAASVCALRDATLLSVLAYSGPRPKKSCVDSPRGASESTRSAMSTAQGPLQPLLAPVAHDLKEHADPLG
jgi:hypothetical protein